MWKDRVSMEISTFILASKVQNWCQCRRLSFEFSSLLKLSRFWSAQESLQPPNFSNVWGIFFSQTRQRATVKSAPSRIWYTLILSATRTVHTFHITIYTHLEVLCFCSWTCTTILLSHYSLKFKIIVIETSLVQMILGLHIRQHLSYMHLDFSLP